MSSRLRRCASALAMLVVAAGCSNSPTPIDSGVTDTGIDVVDVAIDVRTGCQSNAACAGTPGRPLCDTASGQCVSCTAMPTACSAAQYCNTATGACEAGCASDEGCASGGDGGVADGGAAAGRCDTITHTCVQCVTNDHCPPGNLCRGSVCVTGCSATTACPTGSSCCDGACIDTQSNIAACGACGTSCRTPNGRAACTMGTCGIGMCTMPYENCDMNAANGCEVNLQTDPNNCGACGTVCPAGDGGVGTCTMGRCGIACAKGTADCNGRAEDGCEVDTRTDPANCNACGRACSLRNANSACEMSACTVASCSAGFGDCDGDVSTGCETSTATSPLHCGACGNACNLSNVSVHGCATGACTIVECAPGFADCDGMASNGCEVNTDASGTNCGACRRSCGAGTCTRGVCTSMCAGSRGDCDGNVTNGCEADLNTETLNCGACRNACVAGPQSTPRCTSGACSIVCATGFRDCNGAPADGCEIDTRVSNSNCGACGNVCPTGQTCNNSICVAPCPGVQTRCSGVCVSLLTDNNNCGGCGSAFVCATGSTCTDGVCRCAIGTEPLAGVRCGAACVDVLSSATNCGTCGNACPSGTTCTRGVCRCSISGVPVGLQCGATCVDPFSDRNNCGACGRACATGESCVSGSCRCTTSSGAMGSTCGGVCSDPATDRNNCGACGNACPASQVCVSGACRACATGTTFCAGACIDTTSNTSNCGACGVTCATGQVCLAGACTSAPPTRYAAVASPAGVTFVDACAAAGRTVYLAGADDSNVVVALPFAFRYWATNLPVSAPINITSNGWIGLDGTSTATYNFPIPAVDAPNAVVAGYEGDDYNRATGQCVAVIGTAPTRQWINEWADSAHCCDNSATGAHTTYEIILREGSNIIDFVYQTMTGTRAQYVGLENQTGTLGVGGCPGGGYNCAPASGYTVRFNPIP